MKMGLKSIILSLVLVNVLAITGCQNTVEGFGKDMQQTGKEIQKSTQ